MNLPTINSMFEQYRNILGHTDILHHDSCMENDSFCSLCTINVLLIGRSM